MGCRYFKGGLYNNNQTNSDTTKQVYFDTGDLEPGEYGSNDSTPFEIEEIPDYMQLTSDEVDEYPNLVLNKTRQSISGWPNINNPIPQLIEDSSFWHYYKNNPKFTDTDRDSLKNWIKHFSPVDEEREIKNLIEFAGDRFFYESDEYIKFSLLNAITVQIPEYMLRYNDYWADLSSRSREGFNLYSLEGPLERIWNESTLFFDKNIYYTYDFTHDKRLSSIFNRINKITVKEDNKFGRNRIENIKEFSAIRKSITSLKNDYLENKMYFLLWHRVYALDVSDTNSGSLIDSINIIANESNELTDAQIAEWNLAVAKMKASVNFDYNNCVYIFNFLKAVEKLLENPSNQEDREKSHIAVLTRATFWSLLPGATAKGEAANICREEYKKTYSYLSDKKKAELYSHIVYYRSLFVSEMINEKRPVDKQIYLDLVSNITSATWLNDDEYNETALRNIISLSNYYVITKNYKEARKLLYILLSRVLNNPYFDNTEFNPASVINRIQEINIITGDSADFYAWNIVLKESGMGFLWGTDIDYWSEIQKEFFLNTVKLPINQLIATYNSKWLSTVLSDLAKDAADKQKWQLAYKLMAKCDSIYIEGNEIFYYTMAFQGSQGYKAPDGNRLVKRLDSARTELKLLNKEKFALLKNIHDIKIETDKAKAEFTRTADSLKRISDSVKVKEARIDELDSTITKKESKIGTLTSSNEARKVALIIAGILLLMTIIITIVANQQKIIANYEAAINKYRSSMSFLDKHLISNVGALLKSHVRKGHPEEAASLIDDFTSLNRSLLLSLTSLHTTLYDEIKLIKEFLTIYTKTENNFNFNIHTPENWQEVQSMGFPYGLLQLFCENSLKHGLKYRPNEYSKTIDIIINHNSVGLDISIIDNGVGRAVAKLRAKRGEESFGNAIAQSKVEGYNKIKKADFDFHYPDDRYGADGICLGTTVSIKATKYEIENTNIDSR